MQQSAPLGKGFPGFTLLQLSMPQNRPSSQSLLLSQSPSLSVHLFSVLQHDHVSLSVNGCPGVPVQSHEIEFTEFQNIEKHRYTGGWNVWEWFLAANQGNHQNLEPSLLTNKFWLVFMGLKQKKTLKKKNQNGWLKKTDFFQNRQYSIFFVKISWIGPWIRRIDWCKGHWCGSFLLHPHEN